VLRHDLDDEHVVLGGQSNGRSLSPLPKSQIRCCTRYHFKTRAPRKSETPEPEATKRIDPEGPRGLHAAGKEV
jgi:hypothetical protein